jgi:hypothetical protein
MIGRGGSRTTAAARAAWGVLVAAAVSACAAAAAPEEIGAWPDGPVLHEFGPDFGSRPGANLIQLDSGNLSDDGTEVTVSFTAGKPFMPDNPCAQDDIRVWVGADDDGGLGVAVTRFRVPRAATMPPVTADGLAIGCSLEGWGHEARLRLAEPYRSRSIGDLASGRLVWVDPPEPYIVPGDLPDGWTDERAFSSGWDVPAVWTSVFAAPIAVNPDFGWNDPGHLVLRQGLDGPPASMLGPDAVESSVTVAGQPATLRRDLEFGQVELAWQLDGVPSSSTDTSRISRSTRSSPWQRRCGATMPRDRLRHCDHDRPRRRRGSPPPTDPVARDWFPTPGGAVGARTCALYALVTFIPTGMTTGTRSRGNGAEH